MLTGLQLEDALSHFMGTREAIVYSYDIATITSIIPAFANRKDVLVVDEVGTAGPGGMHLIVMVVNALPVGACAAVLHGKLITHGSAPFLSLLESMCLILPPPAPHCSAAVLVPHSAGRVLVARSCALLQAQRHGRP